MEWNKEMEEKILKKSRFTLTVRILRLLLIGVLVYGAYMAVLSISSEWRNVAEENDFYTKLALDWKIPNVRGSFDFEQEEITVFGTKNLSYPLVKKVGRADVVIGEADVTKHVFNSRSYVDYQLPGREQINEFSFSLPEDPRSGNQMTANPWPNVWETLEMLHEGTVAELAFSTDRFLTPEELIEAMQPYEVDVLWMPLYTGEFVDFTPNSWGGSGNNLTLNGGLGLAGARTSSEDFQSSSLTYRLDTATIADSEKAMLQNMGALLAEKPSSYYEGFLGLGHLPERYEYLQENGFTAYGAVVTGPVKELLKLEGEELVHGEQLGEVELWDWE
ncbi:anti sigma factor C-terminal domain-containing protein [Planococcus salinus]|nr:anti sigma factor C-terminal domain-containing protein [Planococcus salinus]